MKRAWLALWGLGVLLPLSIDAAQAQNLAAAIADPTRPPAAFAEPAADPGAARGRVLQSVLIPRKGKPRAVIDGQQVGLGQHYGDARLVKISEREVVLEGPQGIERLQLTPGVEKMNISNESVTRRVNKAPVPEPARGEGKP